MSHPREEIRGTVVALLATPTEEVYPTAAEGRVYPSRVKPLFDKDLPAILVYILSEEITGGLMSATLHGRRQVEVVVDTITRAEDLDDVLDDFSQAIETALLSISLLGLSDLVERVSLSKTETGFTGKGDHERGCLRLFFSVTYWFEQPEAEIEEPADLERIHNEFDIRPHGETFESDHEAEAELE